MLSKLLGDVSTGRIAHLGAGDHKGDGIADLSGKLDAALLHELLEHRILLTELIELRSHGLGSSGVENCGC